MGRILEDPSLHNRTMVFLDRTDAGVKLAAFIQAHLELDEPMVCAIPAGGIPVGLELARAFGTSLVPAVVRKLKIPWNPEAGFGAMTWDGRIFLNQPLASQLRLSQDEIRMAEEQTREVIRQRLELFAGGAPPPSFRGRTVILTDDGLASGYTMLAAIEAVLSDKPGRIVVAVPTGSKGAVSLVAAKSESVVCLNLKDRYPFAVADAYRHWHDLPDKEVLEILRLAEEIQGG
ncbi:MAG: phosphoribosyltransferase [Methanomicrobiales archaeon]|nr:phosphoribosyltransferase [Methanomicrobiales archaeon]NYT21592.1 phosphoribosyltransferase [Methanomicrobiales archaeon]